MGDGKEPDPLARDRPNAAISPEELARARPPPAERDVLAWEPPGSGGAAEAAASPSPGPAGAAAVLPLAAALSRAGPSRPAPLSSPEALERVDSPSVLRLPSRQAQQLNCPESSSPSIWCAQAEQRPFPHPAHTVIWRVPFLTQHSHRRLRRRWRRRRRSPLSAVRLLRR